MLSPGRGERTPASAGCYESTSRSWWDSFLFKISFKKKDTTTSTPNHPLGEVKPIQTLEPARPSKNEPEFGTKHLATLALSKSCRDAMLLAHISNQRAGKSTGSSGWSMCPHRLRWSEWIWLLSSRSARLCLFRLRGSEAGGNGSSQSCHWCLGSFAC